MTSSSSSTASWGGLPVVGQCRRFAVMSLARPPQSLRDGKIEGSREDEPIERGSSEERLLVLGLPSPVCSTNWTRC